MQALSFLSGAILLGANLIYIIRIWQGETKPIRGSWITWAVLDIALIAGMYIKDAVNGQVVAGTVTSSIIAGMSICWGKPGWSTLRLRSKEIPIEKICLWVLPFGLALWWFTRNADWNIIVSNTLIAFACLPTYASAWKDPKREDKTAWTMMLISSLVMLPAIRAWTIADATQPIVWLVTQIPMVYIVWLHHPKQNRLV
ncbi:hypothetical protein HY413_03785 [Candidatus Kaiserbacteria bacterium]|nr:hypothetical protein [Candidatus Kaiserbacteria bacterium]